MAEVSLGVLMDIMDEEWMRDTLPVDVVIPLSLQIFHCHLYWLLELKIRKTQVCLYI
ncbi:hypothetical protein CK203_057489 [Vitis vinifera]|uniref:Anaphase-promoting complex subunit 13 n=1 Tax=Vitis vinifera TaxID=29760 RepID=A0A438FT61_VITVI|nr:hypothetical protein CK203_057489 [Vitis vinifera]